MEVLVIPESQRENSASLYQCRDLIKNDVLTDPLTTKTTIDEDAVESMPAGNVPIGEAMEYVVQIRLPISLIAYLLELK